MGRATGRKESTGWARSPSSAAPGSSSAWWSPRPGSTSSRVERKAGFYPGKISNILETAGQFYLDPFEDFATELLRQTIRRQREGKPTTPNPLFNGQLGDGHFSPLGCEVWARAVSARLVLLLRSHRTARFDSF